MPLALALLALALGGAGSTGCAKLLDIGGGGGDGSISDGDNGIDAPPFGRNREAGVPGREAGVDAPPDGSTHTINGPTLLLSEISLAPDTGEFIEIVNPTSATVHLDNYFLSDSGDKYFTLPVNGNRTTVDANDFIAQFPAGSTIASKQVITVALSTGAAFNTAYGVNPDYSLADGTIKTIAVNMTPSLTNGGESIILFYWDGMSDLVQDVDIMLAGAPSAANGLTDKSGVAQDGPDADSTTTAYASDSNSMLPQASAPGSGLSTKRLLLETGHETQHGAGNGINGDDETSEATAITWDSSFTVPDPGHVPAALLVGE